ncbi:MAG: P-II family nitrogen regulator [Lachnospiraceae bacterium]|nr:P-II family nitrogen regulator [Lachnospiraceae bacterium]
MSKIYKIEIITRKEKFQELKDALNSIGVEGMTVYDVQGCGVQKGIVTYYRGVKTEVQLIPKIKVETVVSEVPYEKVLETAERVLKTGAVGDGKVFVSEICDVLRVRTGERGVDAIQNN